IIYREFSQRVQQGEKKCCHYSNYDCTPNSSPDDMMDFNLEIFWLYPAKRTMTIPCQAGGSVSVYGEDMYFWIECQSPNGEIKSFYF
ncbi:hypothetical protein BY458DRAFT_430441, partial [Sporodiniella umbellata]